MGEVKMTDAAVGFGVDKFKGIWLLMEQITYVIENEAVGSFNYGSFNSSIIYSSMFKRRSFTYQGISRSLATNFQPHLEGCNCIQQWVTMIVCMSSRT